MKKTYIVDKGRCTNGFYVITAPGTYVVKAKCTITFSKKRPLTFKAGDVSILVEHNDVGIIATPEQFNKLEIEYSQHRPPTCDTTVKAWGCNDAEYC